MGTEALEALALCLFGGLVGVLVGLGTGALVAALNGWAFLVSPAAIGIALGFSLAVGPIFGVWPARRAARLNPIEALRCE